MKIPSFSRRLSVGYQFRLKQRRRAKNRAEWFRIALLALFLLFGMIHTVGQAPVRIEMVQTP
jgi:hypothetical protein